MRSEHEPGRGLMRRLLNTSHKRLTAAAAVTGALATVALIGPFSDRTYYCFLVAFVGFSLLAINAANRRVKQIFEDDLDDPDPFATRLRVEYRNQPTDTGETR